MLQATFGEVCECAGDAFDPQFSPLFETTEQMTYEVRLPEDEPEGILIYISPKAGAALPEGWEAVLDELNLAWVGALDSGNEIHVGRRVGMAQLAPALLAQSEDIQSDHVILSGFSGGGRVASMMIAAYPEMYSGALFICGANPIFVASDAVLARIEQMPLVFLTGTGDFNLADTQMAISTFHQAGAQQAQLMVVDGLGHALPEARDLEPALTFLSHSART